MNRSRGADAAAKEADPMEFREILRIAFRALARNKMRSSLTMLGIIIGVGAVIAMVCLGQAAQKQVEERISSMGSNLLYVSAGSVNRAGTRLGSGATKTLTEDDLKAILREVPTAVNAAPGAQQNSQVVYENLNWSTTITGTEPAY